MACYTSKDRLRVLAADVKRAPFDLWHQRLGHLNKSSVQSVLAARGLTVIEPTTITCKACVNGNMQEHFKSKAPIELKTVQQLMAIDYVGPMRINSFDEYTGMLNIMVEPFHLGAVYPLKSKSYDAHLHAIKYCVKRLKALLPSHRVTFLKSVSARGYTDSAAVNATRLFKSPT